MLQKKMSSKKTIIVILCILFFIFLAHILLTNTKETFTQNKYTAVIVEPREHKALALVLNNFLENLSDEWNVIIMHGNKNISYVQNIIQSDLTKHTKRIQMIDLNVDNLTIDDYNQLLTSEKFYEYIPTEIFLIFQTDTIICENQKTLINNFLQYDYVGAPWKDAVGNGGFSLRRKSKTLEIISKCKRGSENEDIYFANPCVSIFKPGIEKAKLFSVEAYYSDKSFGVHKPWAYLTNDEMEEKVKKCAPLKELLELNK
jgi:hypothetical protein